jgi:hypothetical protein
VSPSAFEPVTEKSTVVAGDAFQVPVNKPVEVLKVNPYVLASGEIL